MEDREATFGRASREETLVARFLDQTGHRIPRSFPSRPGLRRLHVADSRESPRRLEIDCSRRCNVEEEWEDLSGLLFLLVIRLNGDFIPRGDTKSETEDYK